MLCVVQVGYGLGVKTVLVSGCFGAYLLILGGLTDKNSLHYMRKKSLNMKTAMT